MAVGVASGAGGANVVDNNDIARMYAAADLDLPPLPDGVTYTIAIRRMARSGTSEGRAIEDVGVEGADQYTMTRNDILNHNEDLIDYCAKLIAAS